MRTVPACTSKNGKMVKLSKGFTLGKVFRMHQASLGGPYITLTKGTV